MGVTIIQRKGNAMNLDAPSPEDREAENKRLEEELHSGSLVEEIAFIIKQASYPDLIPTAQPSEWVQGRCTDDPEYRDRYVEAIRLMLTLTKKADFKNHFPPESKAQDNEKYRSKTLDPRLYEFTNYLIHIGVRPEEGWSVDRINPKRGYLYGNMRWATPQTQTDNQRLKKWHEVPGKGQMTIASLAKYLGQKYDTVYHALKRGNTVDHLISRYGTRVNAEHAWQFPPNIAQDLESAYRTDKKPGQSRLAWCCHHLPQWIRDMRSANMRKGEIGRMECFFHESMAELQKIRTMKKTEKHKLAFAVLQGLNQPECQEPFAFNMEMPKDAVLVKSRTPFGDDDGLIEHEHPAYGVVPITPLALAKPAPIMHLVKPVAPNLSELLEMKGVAASKPLNDKSVASDSKEAPITIEEIENDPFFAKYNKPWMLKKSGC